MADSDRIVTNRINKGLVIGEYADGIRFGTDALLVSHFCRKGRHGCDLGSGSGVISLLLLSLGKASHMTGIERDEGYASLSQKNAAANGFGEGFNVINADVLAAAEHIPAGSMDFAVSNPPYLGSDCGKRNMSERKYAAFHETTAGIDSFCRAASYILKSGGRFFCVYRPEYIAKLFSAADACALKLKKLRFVYPSAGKPPCLVLAEFRKDGGDGAVNMPPLFIYGDAEHKGFSTEMSGIYASFGE